MSKASDHPGRARSSSGLTCSLLAMVVMAVCVACSPAGSGGEGAEGQRLYRQNCSVCHGIGGEGRPSMGASLKASEFVSARADPELVGFLAEGRSADHPDNKKGIAMPPRGGNPRLTDEDLALIVGFLRTLE